MKKIILLIVIFVFVATVGLVGYSIGWFHNFGKPAGSGPNAEPVTTPPVTTAPANITVVSPNQNVNFDFAISDISGTGLSRTVKAQVTDTGTADAHNVWAKVEVFSQGARVGLSNNEFLRVDVGTIKAGTTVTEQVVLQFNVIDGLKITQSGAQFVMTIYSDEKIQTFNYDYKP